MINRAKSTLQKAQISHVEKDELEKVAVAEYQQEQSQELKESKKRKGAQRICEKIFDKHFADTGKCIKLNHATLISHFKGKNTMSDFNCTK
ncbi:hypothetical protein EV360DRAFT_57015 [Lentinula raphanica]|nr:hypothetical protein EV360DRAFT_57015 [Lentinula raphanica]